jgi:ribosomal protein S18 acetylase RimI-like enzyme
MQLEVLVRNAPAIRIYEALGFRRTRGLVVWRADPDTAPTAAPAAADIVPLDHGAALDVIDHWVSDRAPWQRAHESIAHLPPPLSALGSMRDGALVGAVVYRAVPERVSFLGLAAREPRRDETLQSLVAAVRTRSPGAPARFLNLPEGDPAEAVFQRIGAHEEARQVEMRLEL